MRRMSCSLTVEAVRNRTKTVTRRHVGGRTWRTCSTRRPGPATTAIYTAWAQGRASEVVARLVA